jgi:hypothetical protein
MAKPKYAGIQQVSRGYFLGATLIDKAFASQNAATFGEHDARCLHSYPPARIASLNAVSRAYFLGATLIDEAFALQNVALK